ncbi:hypothetical protein FOL47_007422 [Perkinsus chesapeaki]|uniref:Protein kinase domain-containing protein n=1 Tax=Perkinsus chesapeaki TaxID=330153 RepID=A0A7J6LLK1_PERCH|nr:hypothetical protein FOL47_007422 [Perkinsus chesapeaki]
MRNLQRKLTLRHLLHWAAVSLAGLDIVIQALSVKDTSDPTIPEILICLACYTIQYKFQVGSDLFATQLLPTMLLFPGPYWCKVAAGVIHALHIAVTMDPPTRLREALVLRMIEVALSLHIIYVLRVYRPWPLLGLFGVALAAHWEDADILCDLRQLLVCFGATCCDLTLFMNAFGVAASARRVRAVYIVSRLVIGMLLLLLFPQHVITSAVLMALYFTCQGWIVVVRPISVPLSEIKVSDNKAHPSDRCLLTFFEYDLRKRLADEVEEIETGLDAESEDEFEDCADASVPFCIERFRERAELGKGEFGRCVWVFDVSSGREYAVKYLNKSIYRRRGLTSKAAEELRIVSGISHQNVVTFYGAYETADTWAFVFEYCNNGDLAAYMSRNNPVDPVVALGMASRILQALNYLHQLWIVYRDLKPANVVLDYAYNPKLCDFGLAIWRHSPDATCRTFCGSAGYCAPEVRTGPEYDDKCDIFSWGALTWALVTGMQAHLHRSWASTLSVHRIYERVEYPKLGFPSTLDRKIKIQTTLHWKDVPDEGEYCKIIPLAYWTGLNLWLVFQRVSVDGYPFGSWLANDLLEWQYMLLDQWIRMAAVPTPSVGMETHRMERLLVGMSQTLDEACFALPHHFEDAHPTSQNSPEEMPISVAGTPEVGPVTHSDDVPLAMRLGMLYHSALLDHHLPSPKSINAVAYVTPTGKRIQQP